VAEDIGAVGLTILAVIAPVVAVIALVVLAAVGGRVIARRLVRRRAASLG
jgi:hypothetical protein